MEILIAILGKFASSFNSMFTLVRNIGSLAKTPKQETQDVIVEEDIADRFIRIFESHGVHRNQIPRFFGHGIELKHITNKSKLINKLSNETINDVVAMFAINKEWLEGASSFIYTKKDFYKVPYIFERFLVNHKLGMLPGCLLWDGDLSYESISMLILTEEIENPDNLQIDRYHITNNWSFGYWKSRVDLIACITIAWKKGHLIQARIVNKELIEHYINGTNFIEEKKHSEFESNSIYSGEHFYPDLMAEAPEKLVEGFTIDESILAIKRWLQWNEKGYISNENDYELRQDFERYLDFLKEKQSEPTVFQKIKNFVLVKK